LPQRAHDDDLHERQPTTQYDRFRCGIGGEIRLAQDHDRLRAALPEEGQVPLDPANVEVLIERLHEEHGVHVRRDDLLCRSRPRLLTGKAGTTLEHVMDERQAAGIGRHGCRDPVAGARTHPRAQGRVASRLAGQLGRMVNVQSRRNPERAPLLLDNASRYETARLKRMELRFEKRGPAQGVKRMQWRLLSFDWNRGETPT
jgi:hypothetical protein